MNNRYILGLDIGTNSIGWAIVEVSETGEIIRIVSAGCRIIPMDAAVLGDFDKGNSQSQTKERTQYRITRRMIERSKLRRTRLHRILKLINFLPEHYAKDIDRYGRFINDSEPKLAWDKDAEGRPVFIFRKSFEEMLADFRQNRPELVADGKKVPYDWTIYYLRTKALTQKISKEELAWILLNFNQKRGYYQLREEEEKEASPKNRQYFDCQVVTDITDTNQSYKGLKIFTVTLEDGSKGKYFAKEKPNWIGQKKNIIATVDIDKNGEDKRDETGEISCRFKIPTEQEWDTQWALIKIKTEKELTASKQTVGEYIYHTLLQMPTQKIRGKLVRTIERKYYKDELCRILQKQSEFHPEFQDRALYEACINELYPLNDAHRQQIHGRGLAYLLADDILFYQRPLKSKKSLIADCPYESHSYVDKETGEIKSAGVKCIAKSHPLYQEFRLWQFLSNLRIYERQKTVNGKLYIDCDVTNDFLKDETDYTELFDWLSRHKTIKQDAFLKYPPFGLKKTANNYRWNYVEDKSYPCNETHAVILERLKKAGISSDFLTAETELALWHILYSISDKEELEKALRKFAGKHGLDEESFVAQFINTPPFAKDYGSYSAKAIKKLLPLMRMGKYRDAASIDAGTVRRIETGDFSEDIKERAAGKGVDLTDINSLKGLPLWLACYIVYNRHSEAKDIRKWEKPSDIDNYLYDFKQHSLRNPIVEQVVLETLRVVRDIWKQTGRIDEIHVELGREMKNPKDKRAKISKQIQENENTNLRIKAMMLEFMNPEFQIDNVRPYSPSQQDLLRIYEEGVLNSTDDIPEEILSIIKKFNESDVKKRPTTSEVLRYKCWLEQKYRSPYTGNMIPLGKLFTPAYEIEHIIPQSRYFDDSFSNKVVCEAEVNKMKSNMLGYEFICKHHGEKVQLNGGKHVEIQSKDVYEKFVKDNYSHNPAKMKKLLMEEIPEDFIARQLNDSRYISKLVKSLLSNIVREENEQEDTSKNVIVCTGGITDRLKKDWGINDVWDRIILPRFMRLNEMEGATRFTSINGNGHEIPVIPLELQRSVKKKRIDHRHHAMDAIIIACAGRNIVNYLNNEAASEGARLSRHDLQRLLCDKCKTDDNGNYHWLVKKPWETFTQDVYDVLQNIVVSFKQNLRVISKTKNRYQHYENGKKTMIAQNKGDNLAIRKPMHKETVHGEVNLRMIKQVQLKEALKNPNAIVQKDFKKKVKAMLAMGKDEKQIRKYFEDNKEIWQDIDLKKIRVYYFTQETNARFFAVRKPLDTSFNKKKIESITDTGIQQILQRHLEANGNDADKAFSPEGIEEMNRNIVALNNGKPHQPILKVRWYEESDKFAVGSKGNKATKFVEAAKGTNLFFAIYKTEKTDSITGEHVKERSFATIPFNVVIDRQKRGLPSAPEDNNGNKPKYVLSPNDFVYVPTEEELKTGITQPLAKERIYKFVSCTGRKGFFIQATVANSVVDKKEFSSLNKMERAITGEMIKEICIPVHVDRLGNITLQI